MAAATYRHITTAVLVGAALIAAFLLYISQWLTARAWPLIAPKSQPLFGNWICTAASPDVVNPRPMFFIGCGIFE